MKILRYIKFPRGFRGRITVGTDGIYSRITDRHCCRQIVSCYDKTNTVVDCAVDVYLHAFSATAEDGDMPLTSNSDSYFLAERTAGTIEYESWCDNPERTDRAREISLAHLWENNQVRPDRRLVTIYTELRRMQTKFPYIFSIYSDTQSEEKETVVCYLVQLHIISSSGTTDCIQGIYSIVQNVYSRRRFLSISYASVSIRNLLLLLTILSVGRDLPSIPSTGWHLCCSLATSSARGSLSLHRGVCFDTPRKQTLQADYRRL